MNRTCFIFIILPYIVHYNQTIDVACFVWAVKDLFVHILTGEDVESSALFNTPWLSIAQTGGLTAWLTLTHTNPRVTNTDTQLLHIFPKYLYSTCIFVLIKHFFKERWQRFFQHRSNCGNIKSMSRPSCSYRLAHTVEQNLFDLLKM